MGRRDGVPEEKEAVRGPEVRPRARLPSCHTRAHLRTESRDSLILVLVLPHATRTESRDLWDGSWSKSRTEVLTRIHPKPRRLLTRRFG